VKKKIKSFAIKKKYLSLCRVSLVRPAPAEPPQDRKVARVGGCSGAMQVTYPFFI